MHHLRGGNKQGIRLPEGRKAPQQRQHILVELKEAISETRNLESLCADHIGLLLHCEETLEMVAIDIASVCTDGADWREIRQMVTQSGTFI